MNEEINLKVKSVWALKAYPYHLIVELASRAFAWFSITPFRQITTDGPKTEHMLMTLKWYFLIDFIGRRIIYIILFSVFFNYKEFSHFTIEQFA